MQDTKIELTSIEVNAIRDTSFFEIKWSVMEKISGLLASLNAEIEKRKGEFIHHLPAGVMDLQGKISRGENYLGYPYLVMDFPRIFEKENIFAFRCMFWWGKHFSYTLHVGGTYYEQAKKNFVKNFNSLKIPEVYVCINEDPWEYHFDNHNYQPAENLDAAGFIEGKTFEQEFIKLSMRRELSQWNQIKTDGLQAFELFTRALF